MSNPISSWYAGAGHDLVSRLLHRRASINAIRLRLFAMTITTARPNCPAAQGFLAQHQFWHTVEASARTAHLASPAFDHWAYLADCCRRRMENGEAVSWDDLPAYKGFDAANAEPIEWLLHDFGRFTLDLAIESNRSASGSLIPWDGVVPLSHSGASVPTGHHGLLRWTLTCAGGKGRCEIGDFVQAWPEGTASAAIRGHTTVKLDPCIERMPKGRILISHRDPLVQREWVQAYVNPDGTTYLPAPSDLTEFRDHYDAGLRLIESQLPELGHDLAFGLHTIIPVGKPAEDRGVSCTSDTFWGAILCCDNPPVLAAEVLIHEFGHNVFNEVLARDGVFKPSLSADEVLYSPWREDPRPVLGLFHATFVFTRVSEFYAKYTARHPEDDDAQYRFRLLLACTRIACRSLAASDSYEPFGRALIHDLTERTDMLARLPHAALQKAEKVAIITHFESWCTRNPALADRNRFKMPT